MGRCAGSTFSRLLAQASEPQMKKRRHSSALARLFHQGAAGCDLQDANDDIWTPAHPATWRSWLTQGSAKPRFAGSNPAVASKNTRHQSGVFVYALVSCRILTTASSGKEARFFGTTSFTAFITSVCIPSTQAFLWASGAHKMISSSSP